LKGLNTGRDRAAWVIEVLVEDIDTPGVGTPANEGSSGILELGSATIDCLE
jgi:hypothetical protein